MSDTGTSNSDHVTSDPSVRGTVVGNASNSWTEVRFDHHADGSVDSYLQICSVGEQFIYDPNSVDYALSWYAGSFTLNYQVVDYDESYNASPGEWQSFTYTLEQPSEIDVWDDSTYMTVYDGMSTVDFGNATVGSPLSHSLTIHNNGYGVLTLDPVSLSVPAGFRVLGGLASEIAPYSSASLTIELEAAAAGSYAGSVSFATNDSDENPFDFAVTGQVSTPEPEIEVQDDYGYTILYDGMSTVDFGSTTGGSPLRRSFSIYNYGEGTLTLDPALLSVPSGFRFQGVWPSAIGSYSSASFTVELDAAVAGSYGGVVSFRTNDSDEDPFDFTVSGQVVGDGSSNAAPTLDLIPDPPAINEDAAQRFIPLSGITAGGGESQTLTVTATSSNPQLITGLSVTYVSPDTTGTLVFTPAANQSGTALITVKVKDDGGAANGGVDSIQRTFQVPVNSVNDAPFLAGTIAPIEVVVNSVLTVVGLDPYFDDADIATSGDVLQYAASVNPPLPNDPDYDPDLLVATIVDRALNLQYPPGRTGYVDVTVRASDQAGLWTEATVRVTVTPVGNSAPVVVDPIEDFSVEAGQPDMVFDLSTVFADADVAGGTDSLAYSVTNSAPTLVTDTLSGTVLTLSLIPGQLGTAGLTVRAADSQGASAETSFTMAVVPFNNPPTATPIPPVVVDEDAADVVLSLRDFFSDVEDPDEDLIFEVALASSPEFNPVVSDLNSNTGELSLSFLANGYGNAEYAVTASDRGGKTVATPLSVTVNALNDAPTGPVVPVEFALEPSPAETLIDLGEYFYDVEDEWDLTYEIVAGSITNPALFEGQPSIDGDRHLRLHASVQASGTSDLMVQASDSHGLWVFGAFTFGPAAAGDGDPSPHPGPQPVVSIVDVKHTGETAAAGYFVVQRQDNSSVTVTVGYELAGDAQYGVDYASGPANGTLTLGPHGTATITINPGDNSIIDGPRTVTLTLEVPDESNVGLGIVSMDLIVNDDDAGAIVYVAHAKDTREGATDGERGEFTLETIGQLAVLHNATGSGYNGPIPPAGGYLTYDHDNIIPVTGLGTGPLAVPFSLSGRATVGSDFTGPEGIATSGDDWVVMMGVNSSLTIPIVAVDDGEPEDEEDVTLTLKPGQHWKQWVMATDLTGRWIGSYGEGTYALGSPNSGTLTIEERCGCANEETSSTESAAAADASPSTATPATDQSNGNYYDIPGGHRQGTIGQRGTFYLDWKGNRVKKHWQGGQYVVPAGAMFLGSTADVTLTFQPACATKPVTLIQLSRITAVDKKTNRRVPVTQSTNPADYPDPADQWRKPWELAAITTPDGWHVDVFPGTANGLPDFQAQHPVDPPGSQQLTDTPGLWGPAPAKYYADTLRWEFETYAVCEQANGKLKVIAGLAWGFQLGTVEIEPGGWSLPREKHDVYVLQDYSALNGPSTDFLAAMAKFNTYFHTAYSVE